MAIVKALREQHRPVLKDVAFLVLVTLVSIVPYVGALGFYSDDWAVLGLLTTSVNRFPDLTQNLYIESPMRQRPVQIVYVAALYTLFGTTPLGYHLVNAIVLLSGPVLLYLALRQGAVPRTPALAVSAVYTLLPNYSTDRFWIAAFQAPLSMSFYFLSLYADLRAVQAAPKPKLSWKIVSVLGMLGSTLAYEVALPLFLLNPLLIVHRTQQIYGRARGLRVLRSHASLLFGSSFVVLILVVLWKAAITTRAGLQTNYVDHLVSLIAGALRINFGVYGLALPYVILWILYNRFDWVLLGTSGLVGVLVWVYLKTTLRQKDLRSCSRKNWVHLLYSGAGVFALGYAIFLTTDQITFSSAGIGNRVGIASAVGVALMLVACLGWLSTWVPIGSRHGVFSAMVAVLCGCGILIVNTLAGFWVEAYRQEGEILSGIREHFPELSAGSTLVLDGTCPEVGPAIVFESHWDLAGALATTYHDPTLQATVVSPGLLVQEEGLLVPTYHALTYYPYSDRLLLYNVEHRVRLTLADLATAREYFGRVPTDHGCPPGFAWG